MKNVNVTSTTSLASPTVAKFLKKQMDLQDMWHALEKEGLKGSMPTPMGDIIQYEYFPDTKQVKARIVVNKEMEQAVLDECKRLRDEEVITTSKDGLNGGMFKITPYVDVTLRFAGIDHFQADWDYDMRKAMYKMFETELKGYKTTNRRLI